MTLPAPDRPEKFLAELRHIDKSFGSGPLFRDFSLAVGEGRSVSVVGSNGSGKTTLLNILSGSVRPDAGEVLLGGERIDRMAEYRRARFLGRVFQDPAAGTCPRLTVLENLSLAGNKGAAFGLTRGVSRRRTGCWRAQLEPLGLGLEDKLDVPVGSLSGGQRQALALLICTLTPIRLLLLDEHTAALDPKSSGTVMELTARFVREKKIPALMVTHNLKYALAFGDRLIMMHRGRIVLDVSGAEKKALSVRDLTGRFDEISIEDGNSV